MPLFEYRCADCKKRFALLIGVVAEHQDEKCPVCGSENISKLMSRFARLRSEDDVMEDLADPSRMGDPDDPKAMRRWMETMGKEMGEDLDDGLDGLMDQTEDEHTGGEED